MWAAVATQIAAQAKVMANLYFSTNILARIKLMLESLIALYTSHN
jgi:hypothetical protein